MPNESTKWLYEQFKAKGYNVGKDQEEFDSLMVNNEESRKWAYETAQQLGFNVGKDQEEFDSLVNPTSITEADEQSPITHPAESTMVIPPSGLPMQDFEEEEVPTFERKTRKEKREALRNAKDRQAAQAAAAEEYDFGDFDKFSNQLGFVPEEQPVSEQLSQAGNQTDDEPLTEEQRDLLSSSMEGMKRRVNQTTESFNESMRIRQAADMSVGSQLRRARQRLEDLQEERRKSGLRVDNEVEKFNKEKLTLLGQLTVGGDVYRAKQMNDPENNALDLAIRQTEELIKNLEEQKDRDNGIDVGFWRGFGRIMGDYRTWDYGLSDLRDARTLINAEELNGENATEGERNAYNHMMEAIYENEQGEAMYGGNASFWNRAGVMTGYMPSFMLDFAFTGGGFSSMKVAGTQAAKVSAKAVGKEVAEEIAAQGVKAFVKKNGLKGAAQVSADWTIKALGTTADDLLIRAPLMTNTIQAGKTFADIADRKFGDVVIDENGNYDFSNDATWGEAIWQGEANSIIENYSEMFGAHLDPIVTLGNMSKLANVVGAKRLGAVLSKADAGALGGIMGTTQQLFNKMGVSDYFGEVAEEYYGQLWRTMLNLDDAYMQNPDGTRTNLFASGQFHGDIWGGMALSMGLMGVGKNTITAAQYASMKHGVNKADAVAMELFGAEIWEPLKQTIDLTTNDDIGAVAESIMKDSGMTETEKAAALNYMEHSLYMRGFNLGTLINGRSEEHDEEIQVLNESYLDGYESTSDVEMNDAKNLYEYHRQRLTEMNGNMIMSMIDANPMSAIEMLRSNDMNWNEEQIQEAFDYLNAKQVYDGMIQRVRDDIDGRIDQSNAMISARTNQSTGMIQGAIMKQDDRKVYVLAGNLVPHTDGTGIDINASDGSIIIRDAETGALEQVSPESILSIEEPQDPYEQQLIAADAIRAQFAQEAANRIDGVASFNPGDTYTLTGENGVQTQVQVVANEMGLVDNGDGTVNVSDGINIFPIAKEIIQQSVDAVNIERVAEFERRRAEERLALDAAAREKSMPKYAMNDEIEWHNDAGETIRGVVEEVSADGILVAIPNEETGMWNSTLFKEDDLNSRISRYNGQEIRQSVVEEISVNDAEIEQINEKIVQNQPEIAQNGAEIEQEEQPTISAYERIPKDEVGNPIYEQAESTDLAWDAILEQTEGDEAMAQTVADGMVADKEASLKKIEKAKAKAGVTITEKIAAEKERKAAVEQAKAVLDIWKKIADTSRRRKSEAEAERRRILAEEAALRKAEEERLAAEQEEAARIEREALNGVPDMADDVPQDARARGYRRVAGHKVDRQQPLSHLQGKEVSVKFSDDVTAKGHVAIIDASVLQPSHIQGMRNPAHFIDEAQPKERNDEASILSARRIAGNIRPEEITSSITAYTGAPTVNSRGEVIQGNNRGDALRLMWESEKEQAAIYKQYLIDHAEEFGLNSSAVAAMKSPVLANMLDVEDDDAITLGQFVAQDTESGGTERIKPKNAVQKMGAEMGVFANMLLSSSDEDTSFAGLVDNNGAEVLRWMNQRGYITATQYKSAFDSKGNITAEAKNDLKGIMYQSIFHGGNTRLEEMFNAMPAKAQRAILATAFRDYDSPNAERMIEEIQNSIRAYYALSQDAAFMAAKNWTEARMAVESWKIQYAMDDVTGESFLPAEKFSNFALHLATMYKGESQGIIQSTFNTLYDLIQGTQEETLFEQPDNTPRTLAQAIYEVLNLEYDGQQRSNVLAGDGSASQPRKQGSDGNLEPRESIESGEQATDDTGRVVSPNVERGRQGEVRHSERRQQDNIQQSKAGEIILSDEVDENGRQFVLNSKGNIEFGEIGKESGLTVAPILLSEGIITNPATNDGYGLVHIEARHGDQIRKAGYSNVVSFIEDVAQNYERIREGNDRAGNQTYMLQITDKHNNTLMVELSGDGTYWNINTAGIFKTSYGTNRRIVYTRHTTDKQPTVTDEASQNAEQSGTQSSSSMNASTPDNTFQTAASKPHGDVSSDGKDSEKSHISKELGQKIEAAEAETDTNPTEKQKEAGNYKKGHVQVGTFNVTIENPKGSIRSGVDANGNKWEVEMHNTYGYIRGTEGVDGDHIDVFLSDNIDSWNGARVFIIDQYNEDGTFDEHKVMLGFNEQDEAETAFLSNYSTDWAEGRRLDCSSALIEDFEKWIASSHRKTKAFADYKTVKNVETSTVTPGTNTGYSIEPAQYTTKRGKVLDMHLVKFERELSKEEQRDAKALAKSLKGWYDNNQGGFMMRSEEDAQKIAAAVMDESGEALADVAPVSLKDTRKVSTSTNKDEEMAVVVSNFRKDLVSPDGKHSVRINEIDGAKREVVADINTDGVGGDKLRVSFSDIIRILQSEEWTEKPAEQPKNEGAFGLVSDARMEELKARLRKKLGGQLNMGIDPEILAIGMELAAGHIDRGVKSFADFAKKMIEDLGDVIRPYLKAFYNGARDLPEIMENGLSNEMTPYDEVSSFDVANFGKENTDPFATADMVIAEQEKMKQADEAREEIINNRNTVRRTENEQKTADTEAIASEAEAIAGEVERRIETATTEEQLDAVDSIIDDSIGNIDSQLETLGVTPAEESDPYSGRVVLTDGREVDIYYVVHVGEQVGAMQFSKPRIEKYYAFHNGQLIDFKPEKIDAAATEALRSPKPEYPYKVGDKVIYTPTRRTGKPTEATIYRIENGRPVLDVGLAPVMYEVADWKELSPIEEPSTDNTPKKKRNKKKSVSSQEEIGGLFDDLFTETNKADAEMHRKFAMTVKADMLAALDNDTKPYRSILDLRKRASELGMEVDNEGRTDILLQELVEDGLVRAAREVIERKGRNSRASYDLICKLYEMQPTIAARSSNRIKMQQYSTPLPMAWIANRFAMANKANGSVLEPTAGNGMLVFTVPVEQVHANELDETRLDNLREQGFAQVTQQDATEPFDGDVRYDVVIANPPFGKRDAVEYDGKMIPGLDPQITLNALSSMKDDGRAAIIIGGNMEYASNGAIKNMKPFFTYLYDHYNVKGVIDMGGGLYAKQGTTFPTRMILIDGRRSDEERAQTAVYPPVESKAIRKAETFDDLYEIINEVLNSNEKTNGTEILRSRQGQLASVNSETSRNTDGAGHRGQHRKNDDVGSRGNRTAENDTDRSEQVLPREHRTNNADGETRAETPRDNAGGSRSVSDTDIQRVGTERVSASGVGLTQTPTEHKKRTLTDEKSAYRPHNSAFSLNSVAPAAMVEAMDKVLTQIEAQHGSIDEFIRTELGYDTVAEAHQALAAEQMDSVAMAIYQMKQGQALIIGDQTGVGKGRQMAALIRWAVKRGEKPVFITQKADLFSDIYRDLVDVGSGDLVPFIFNSDGAMVDSKGNTVHKPLSSAEMAKVFASGVLPDKYDFAVLTYSQVNTGDAVSQQEMDEAAKKNGARTKKSKNVKNGKATPKATFLRAIAEDNYLFLDESHTAAGSSNTGAYLQSILRGAKAATFASATFAKRPDTMPLYAIRTAMSQAKVEPDKMISIIEKGGVTLQEIMSRELTNAGQMVRRERDMSDVVTDWKTITDPETVRRARENYDRTIAAFNAIIKFQEDYVKPMIEALDMELAVMAESAGVKRGTDKMGVENVPFASKTYNYTKQLMLALKVDAIADEVEAEINAGRHPVIALESTMESSIKDYAPGEIIDEPTFSASLLKGLDTVMQYTVKDEDGNERHERYSPKALGPAGEKAYYELQDFIRESTSDIFISPLDAIIERLNEKGYKVGELTGRNTYVERNADGRVVVKRRTDKDKKRMQREFNSGALDVLILNKSASTGISLHASEKFSDQRQRSMIIAQPLSDINDYMQMIGRIDRTGQVHRGYYINLGLPVPAENRFLMMLSTKLKSLNANTTTSQDSESNDVEAPDLLNKYGSQVVVEYLRDNVEIYERMGTPLKKGGLGGGRVQASELDDYKPQEDDARKITGYVALLTTKEQEEFYDDVVRRYNELIKYLNDTGSNDLKINVMPLRAKTIERRVSSEGIDPNGSNPFARNSFVEKVEMDVLRKPMKADEIRKVIEQINRGIAPAEYLESVIDIIRKEDEARIVAEEERYEKAKAKAVEDIAKQTDKINGQKKRSEEEKRVAIENFIAETNEKVEAKHNDNILRLNQSSDQMMHRLRMFEVGKSYLVPDNLESMIFDFATPAIFCGYKTKESKITASTTLAVFATLDGRRRIEIKLSQIDALRSIDKMTNDNWDAARATTLDNWDSQIPSETRKTGFIMTGNILQAIADTQDEHGGYPGQLISYTDIDGNVHDGILMPDKWNASMLKTSGAPLSSRLQQIKDYMPITSHDGKVEIMGSSWAKMFYLTVPKTKKDGAIYYENKTLLRAAGGNFYPYRGQLRADIPEEHITEVVKELTKLGVKVKEEHHSDDALNREGYGAYTDDEVSFENDPISKVLGKPRFTRKQRREFAERERQRMVARVENLAKKLNLDNVEIVTDASTLEGKKQRAKGFYTKSTGKITIVIPNHSSTFDVEQTLLHEAVAHYGLRQLFGEHFDTFLDNVFNNADEAIRQRIVALAAKNGWDFRKATEEYLAGLAERTNFEEARKSGWWQRIKDFFSKMLHQLGFANFRGVTLTDNELRYILWRSYENLKEDRNSSLFAEAADITMQHELKVGEYADDVLYRTGNTPRERYDDEVKTFTQKNNVKWNENILNRLKESYQDSMHALDILQKIVAEESGKELSSFENAYQAENRMSSENKSQAEIYERDFYRPLIQAIQDLVERGADYEDIKAYVIAKHGLERNKRMAQDKAEEAYAKYQKEHPKGTKTLQDFIDEYRKSDYSGLTALTGMEDVADAEAEAERMVSIFENEYSTDSLWEKINAATKETLKKSYDCGMMSKETYEKVRDMYEYYVPLRGWNVDVASNEYEYLSSNRLMLSPALKKAEGRSSLADDPLATIGYMAESSIIQGNRNKMKQKFLNMALNHQSELLSVSKQWYVLDNASGEWEARNPVIPEDATGDEVADIIEQHETDMLALEKKGLAKSKRAGLNLSMHITKREGQEHVVRVMRSGEEFCVYVNGNPRAAQAINGLTNPHASESGIAQAGMVVKNWMARAFTSWNPAFVVSNLARDIVWSTTAVAVKEDVAYTKRYIKNVSGALGKFKLPILLKKYQDGTLDDSVEIERYFGEFIRNGGETGFTQLNTVEDFKRDIERFVKDAQGKTSKMRKGANKIFDGIEFLNRSAEDTSRFMVYMTSRQMGRDMSRSIWDAKEITVNFNKKGSGGLGASVMNFAYIFFNATIQSLANFGKLLHNHPKKMMAALATFGASGLVVPLMNAMLMSLFGGDDDDENAYWDLPEWVRRNNIVIWNPFSERGFLTIPLPHELRALYGMGEIAASVMLGKEDAEEGVKKAAIGFTGMLPFDFTGNGGWQSNRGFKDNLINVGVNLTPTVLQPITQYFANTDYFGVPIYKDTDWNQLDPEWTKAYKGTAPWLVDATKWLNDISGGDNVKSGIVDLNPAVIEHFFDSYLGGMGKTINKASKTMQMLWNEDLREWRNVPIISSFYQVPNERNTGSQINREYWNAVDEIEETEHAFNGYKTQIKMGATEYAEKINELMNSEAFKRYALVKGYKNAISKISSNLKYVDSSNREEVETKIMDLKVEMLEKLDSLDMR